MFRTLTLSAAALVAAAPAIAGGFDTAVVAQAPVAPVAVVTPAPVVSQSDWTGFYVGGDLSYGQLSSDDFTNEGDGYLTGLHAGYQRDLGRVVIGAELEHDWGSIDIEGLDTEVDRVARAKLRVGFDAGRFLPYATAGVARASLSGAIDEDVDGNFYGAGVEVQLNERFSTGVEYLRHQFDDVGAAGVSADVSTIGLRGTIRF